MTFTSNNEPKMYRTLLLFLPLVFLAGCFSHGPFKADTQLVDGMILFDGAPLEGATIKFIPSEEGELATGTSNAEGRFDLTSLYGNRGRGALQGTYRVAVSKETSVWIQGRSEDPNDGHSVFTQHLPRIYQDEENTPLEATVVRGRNRITLELQSR